MPGLPRIFLAALPALAMLAACSNDMPTTTAPPPTGATAAAPMPMTSGAEANAGMSGLSGSTEPPPIQMNSADIQSLLVNNTATGIATNGETYYAWFGPTGQIHFEQGTVRDTGTWRTLPDGRLCSQMARRQSQGEQCYSLYRNGSALTFAQPDGKTVGSFSVLTGNPQDL